jgi:hypothetical protein
MANGTLKVENIQTSSGSGTITLGQSGETIALGSGVTSKFNQPAFRTTLSSDFNIGDATTTNVLFDTVTLDTNSCYNSSTGFFTPNVAGWYKLNTNIIVSSPTSLGINRVIVYLKTIVQDVNVADCTRFAINISDIVYFNGTTDTVQVRAYADVDSGDAVVQATDSTYSGFRIGA